MTVIQVIEKKEVVERLQRNGKKMAFLTGSNQHGILKCLVFGNTWEVDDIRETILNNDILMVKGRKSGNDLIINDVEVIEL